jgi:chloramphenicol-sensitive protein RarD
MTTGIVTAVPLLLFTAAANQLRLSTIDFLQYLAPTLVFLLAVTFYSKTVGQDKLVTFGFIWVALVLFTLEALYNPNTNTVKVRGSANVIYSQFLLVKYRG